MVQKNRSSWCLQAHVKEDMDVLDDCLKMKSVLLSDILVYRGKIVMTKVHTRIQMSFDKACIQGFKRRF